MEKAHPPASAGEWTLLMHRFSATSVKTYLNDFNNAQCSTR